MGKKAPGAPAGGGGSIGFMQALKIPNVMGYALAFGFFKFINYAMFFWLPFFLSLHFDSESANVVSSLYSVGMMPGGVIVGVVSDLYDGRRACVIATFMCILAPLLWMFAMYSDVMNPILLLFMLGVMGILVGGPNNIITSAVAADLAEHPSIGGNTRSLGTVTGIINGSGSITAAFGLMAIGPLQSLGGWTAVWYFLIACTIMGTGLMGPKIWKELTDHPPSWSVNLARSERELLERERCGLVMSTSTTTPLLVGGRGRGAATPPLWPRCRHVRRWG